MLPLQHRTVGKVGVEPTISCSQGTRAATALPPGCFDSTASSSYGSRTHLSALKGRNPQTDRRTSRVCAQAEPVGREALESSSAAFQATAKPFQLPTRFVFLIPATSCASNQQKSPMSFVTPGFVSHSDRRNGQ